VHRGFLDTSDGQIHYVTAGVGRPVLLLHQTPRSWDEYRDVIPILAKERRVIAMELAVARPDQVERLVLSACPFVDSADRDRRQRTGGHRVDHVEAKPDGSHIAELWQIRQKFYPKDRPDLLTRFVADALRAGEKIREGHGSCSRYRMEEKIGKVRCPTLVTWGTQDPYAAPQGEVVAQHIRGSRVAPIEGGSVAVVDEMPEAFARLVLDFLRE
jgi:pimeloyl-ACP methyl ester carboxylesterase